MPPRRPSRPAGLRDPVSSGRTRLDRTVQLQRRVTAAAWGFTAPAPAGSYGDDVLALVLVAVSLGLSDFAAAIGIGISGTSARTG